MSATKLKHILIDKDINLRELSEISGISYSHLSKIVNGKQKPNPQTAHLISRALGYKDENKVFPNLYTYSQLKKSRSK